MSTYEKLGGKTLDELPQVPTNFSYNSYTGLLTWQNNNTTLPASGYTNELQLWSNTQSKWAKLSNVALSATTAPVTGYTAITSSNLYKVRVGVRKTAGFIYPSLTYQTTFQGSRIYAGGATVNIPKQYGAWNGMSLTATGNTTYGSTITAMAISGDYIYVGGAGGTIKKYNLSDLTYTGIESPNNTNGIGALLIIGNYIYAGGYGGSTDYRRIFKYNLSDLTLVTASANHEDEQNAMAYDGTYIYNAPSSWQAAKKLNASTLAVVTTGGKIPNICYAMATDNTTYIYYGCDNNFIYKFNLSTLTATGIVSPSYGGKIRALVISGDYIYAAGATTNTIRRYNLSDLTYASLVSPSYGGTIRTLVISGDYIYAGGDTTNAIRRYKLSDLTLVDSAPSYGGSVYSIALSS